MQYQDKLGAIDLFKDMAPAPSPFLDASQQMNSA